MISIVEGPDGAGKTTLINSLLKSNPGSQKFHFGAPATPEEASNYYEVYAKAIQAAPENVTTIFDRSWYSDVVYGPIMRGKQEMSDIHVKMLDSLVVASGGGMIIYCTAPLAVLANRCKKRGETYVTNIDTLRELSARYSEVMQTVKLLPVVRYDTSVRW
jgi:thymidylate kinase